MIKRGEVKDNVGLSKSTKTLLIIAIVFLSIGMIWVIVRSITNQNKDGTPLDKFSADLTISQVEIINNTDVSVKVDKGTVEGELKSINLVFYNEDGVEIKRSKILISDLERNDFLVSFRVANTSKIKSISITPVFVNKSSGKSVVGKVEDEYTMTGEENTNQENPEEQLPEENTSAEVLPECTLETDCNDNNGCTTDLCTEGNCSHTLVENCVPCSLSSQCEDSNTCTTNSCSGGKCAYLLIPGCTPCGSNLNCNDSGGCTNNICMQGRCLYASIAGCKSCTLDSECEDNDACTENICFNGACSYNSISNCKPCTLFSQCADNDSSTIDSCSGNKCVYTKITSCLSNDNYCPANCNAGNDNDCPYICGNGIREGDEKCDSTNLGGATCAGVLGNGYTGTLKCFSGLCTFDTSLCVAPCTCPSDGNSCTTDQCVDNICKHTALTGTSCLSDNNVCTNDICGANGTCAHVSQSNCCTSSSQCGNGKVCTNNVCVASSTPPTATCSDGIQNQGETGVDCGGPCSVCTTYLRTFYVSSSTGSDLNSGTTQSSPWQTLSKVNSQTFRAGDGILFKRGDIWYGTLIVSSSGSSGNPITYGAYGSDEKPIISGFMTVTGWTNENNGVYSKVISTKSIPNILSVDGENTPIGRWPDTGWLIVDSHSGKTSITDNSLSSSPDWNGGEVIIRKHWWVTDRNKITSHSGNTIYYTSSSDYNAMDGNGYFIQNHVGTLNQIGDWAYVGSKLYIYFGTTDSPNNHVIKIPTIDDFAYLDHKNYITFDNLHITGYNYIAVVMYGSTHITVTNCVFDFIGDRALTNPDWTASSYAVVENNVFNEINNDAIDFSDTSKYMFIQYNTITNIGTISGLSGSGDGSGIGIQSSGDNSLINHNTIQHTGYNGISFSGANSVVSNNFIDSACSNKDDGAGIYTYESEGLGKEITNNIIINGVGAADGTVLSNEMRAHGIYIDGSDNILISGNSIYNNFGAGMFINTQALNMNIQNNTVFDNSEAGIQIVSNMGDRGSIRGMNMQNNIFFAKETAQKVLYFVTTLGDSDVTQIGTVNNNYYTRPIDEAGTFKTQINAWGGPTTYRTLSGWQSYSGLDSHSKKSPKTITSVNDLRFEYNPTGTAKIVSLGSNYIDVKGNAYSGSVTLQPYTSIVLIKN